MLVAAVTAVVVHDPTHEDITRFLRRFQRALEARGLALLGITTDGSSLSPGPIAEVFGPVPHQVCQFHVIAELTQAILKAVAKVRRHLKKELPKLPRGRPSAAQKTAVRRKKRLQKKITALFDHRHLFVKHHLTPAEKKTLKTIPRGLRHLRTLRNIMDEVYRLFDRRCRTETALAKLARLRCRVRRFKSIRQTLKRLFSPNPEKALTFLDDSHLPATSNAVERGNRRHRKMQKGVYRVRTQPHIHQRIALDMLREARWSGRTDVCSLLHLARSQPARLL
jgi:hypothetical protein